MRSFSCCTMLVAQSSGLEGPNQAPAAIPEHHSNFWSPLPAPQDSTQSSSLTEFAVYSDASFAPSGKGSQSGYCVMLTYGTVRHLVHWHSTREKKVAESSAESELYALSTASKAGRNFRLLVQEFLTTDLLLNLRCDNEATIATLEEPSWRTRYRLSMENRLEGKWKTERVYGHMSPLNCS